MAQMAIICDGFVHMNSWWGYGVDVVWLGEAGGGGSLGGVCGMAEGNCKLWLLYVVLGGPCSRHVRCVHSAKNN